MDFNKLILTNNDCYKTNRKMTPKGIVVHSTGVNNPNLSRYVQPNDGRLGTHKYSNHWNRGGFTKCVHAMIGLDVNGKVCTYQTLPLDICCWGCGKGSKGSYNYDPAYLQFEILEDGLSDKSYYNKVMKEAQELCAKWCKEFGIPLENVVSHKEAHARGYASNHADIDHWLKKFGDTMDDFRDAVKTIIDSDNKIETEPKPEEEKKSETTNGFKPYIVNIKYTDLNIRSGAGTNYAKTGKYTGKGMFTIIAEADGKGATKWGKLESGAGWISLDYAEFVKYVESEKEPEKEIEIFKPYIVRIDISNLRIRSGAGTNYASKGYIAKGVYTIVEEADGKGATKWGKLKSGAGWISLDYAEFVKYMDN